MSKIFTIFDFFIKDLISSLSNDFELLIYTHIALAIMFGLLFLFLMIREVQLWFKSKKFVKNFLFFVVTAGEFFLIYLTGYIFWLNYRYPLEKYLVPQAISYETFWVEQDFDIYFAKENVLSSIKLNGKEKKDIFTTVNPINEYHFSLDGKYVLIATKNELYKIDRMTNESEVIESISQKDDLKSAVDSIRWSPDSLKFCYQVSKWSSISSLNNLFVYDIESKKKCQINNTGRRIDSLLWDKKSENLYFLRHEALDTSVKGYPYEVKIYNINFKTFAPEFVLSIPHEKSTLPLESLNLRGIDLATDIDKIAFKKSSSKEKHVAEEGYILGVDKDDCLYVIKNKFFKKKLFKILRRPAESDIPRYAYKGGDLILKNMRWIPGGKYIIMEHIDLGLLVLDPWKGKIGQLAEARGDIFGWYYDLNSLK